MTLEDREKIAKNLFEESIELLHTKGKSYAGQQDSLSNFKRNAERLNLTPYQVWAVYFNKHVDSINNAIADNPNSPIDASESLRSRVLDAITYLTILECLQNDEDLINSPNNKVEI